MMVAMRNVVPKLGNTDFVTNVGFKPVLRHGKFYFLKIMANLPLSCCANTFTRTNVIAATLPFLSGVS